jgi:hypothetical protein
VPLCGLPTTERIATHPDFAGTAIYACRECDFGFGAPAPSDAELKGYYQTTYPQRRTWSSSPV